MIDLYSKMIDLYSNMIDLYGKMIDLYGKMIDLYSNMIDLYSNMIDLYGKLIDLYGNMIDLYSKLIDLYGNMIDLYGNMIHLYSNMIDLYSKAIFLYGNMDAIRLLCIIVDMVTRRLLIPLFLILLPLFALFAQEENPGEDAPGETVRGAEIFPAALFLETAEYARRGLWQPDWPLEMPVDAFTVSGGDWLSVTVLSGGEEFCVRRDAEGTTLEFPLLLRGKLARAVLEYGSQNPGQKPVLSSARVSAFAENKTEAETETAAANGAAGPESQDDTPEKTNLVNIEILEYIENHPSLLRIDENSVYSFVLLRRGVGFISESWFDRDGVFLGAYEYHLVSAFSLDTEEEPRTRILSYDLVPGGAETERRSFDSRFMITGVSGVYGDFSVEYFLENLPRYWTRNPLAPEEASSLEKADNTEASAELAAAEAAGAGPAETTEAESAEAGSLEKIEKPGRYGLQWDEAGFLLRLSSVPGRDGAEDNFLDCRYEYTLDGEGNWVERREIRMIRNSGYLVPAPGPAVRRIIEYREKAGE